MIDDSGKSNKVETSNNNNQKVNKDNNNDLVP